jgi:hypothetical protein
MRHVTSLEMNIMATLQTPQQSAGSSSSGPARVGRLGRVGTPTVTVTLRDLAEGQPPRTLGRIRNFLATNTSAAYSTRAWRRNELNAHATPPLAVLERYIAAVREDIARIEDLGEACGIGWRG